MTSYGPMERPEPELVESAARFPSATLHEAMGREGALPAAIKPVAPGMTVCGPAVTVQAKPFNNINIHRAIYAAEPGDVLLADVGDGYEGGYFGEIMAHAAVARKLGGLVINGCVRDGDLLEEIGFPVFARGLAIQGTLKEEGPRGLAIQGTLKEEGGFINQPVIVGDVTVMPGDVVRGDRDGVVVIPRTRLAEAIAASEARENKEAGIIAELKEGKRTLDLFGWSE